MAHAHAHAKFDFLKPTLETNVFKNIFLFCLSLALCSPWSFAQDTDADYKVQGEYSGVFEIGDGQELKYGFQVIALGDGKFACAGYHGGLPGAGWDGDAIARVQEAEMKDGIVTFEAEEGTAVLKDGVVTISDPDGNRLGSLERMVRKSESLGKKPPQGSIILFDGKSVDSWEHRGKPARMTEDGLLMQGAASKQKFGSHHLHIEFQLPYMPKARGQGRGNSGLYLQGRYEVQMLDSFGLTGEQNECGGIYSIRKPDQNMCYPPLQWQAYGVEFHAAQFKGKKKTKDAWMTVKHNGVTIHEKVNLPKKTTAAPNNEGSEQGFVYLQDHGNQVRYRNIWVQPIKDDSATEETDTKPVQSKESVKIDDDLRMDYLAYVPQKYASQDKWPLILFLHGAGERGNDLEKVKIHGPPKLVENGKNLPFIVISPQCPKEKRWNVDSLSKLLTEVESKYKVDKSRIYLTGLSMGGYGSWALAAHSPHRFAAVAPICGGGDRTKVAQNIGSKVPVWVFHGAKDRVVKLSKSQEIVDAFKDLGIQVKFTIYPEANHDSWSATYDNPKLYEWFLKNTKH